MIENNGSYTPLSNNRSLPSIKELFSQSWLVFQKSILNLFLINIISFSIAFLILIVGGVLIFILGGLSLIKVFSSSDPVNFLSQIKPQLWINLGIIGLIIFMVEIVVSSVNQIALVRIIDKAENQPPLGQIIKESLPLIFPLILVSIIRCFFTFGSLFLFIFPLIIVSIFLSYAVFEVIIEGERKMEAVKGSVQIISQHFGEILIRSLIYLLLYIVIFTFIPNFFRKIEPATGNFLTGVTLVFGWIFGWFGYCYSVTLYKQVKTVTDTKKETNLTWLWVIAIIGWIIAGLVAFGLIKAFPIIRKNIMSNQKLQLNKSQTKIFSYIPSNCGLSIPLPDTKDSLTKKYRHWIYEERLLAKDVFRNLAPEVTLSEAVLGGFLGYKSEDKRFKPEDKTFISSTGIDVICVNNIKNWDIDQFIETAKKNDKYTVTESQDLKTWGGVKIYSVYIEGINQGGDYFKEPLNLGVTADGKRLFYIKIWGTSDNDPNKKQLNLDINSILTGLKYREVESAIQNLNPKASGPSCVQYVIREGEFTSNKCYSQKDYNDLVYYLQRFNSAAFTINAANSSMRITCNGSAFFKNSCENDKKRKEKAEGDLNNYRGIINGIIARGK